MNPAPTHAKRPGLELKVADSGRTLFVEYHDILRIPPGALEVGDVIIAHHRVHEGIMAMQVTKEKPGGGFVFEELELSK